MLITNYKFFRFQKKVVSKVTTDVCKVLTLVDHVVHKFVIPTECVRGTCLVVVAVSRAIRETILSTSTWICDVLVYSMKEFITVILVDEGVQTQVREFMSGCLSSSNICYAMSV